MAERLHKAGGTLPSQDTPPQRSPFRVLGLGFRLLQKRVQGLGV